jgi:hypothetical protein
MGLEIKEPKIETTWNEEKEKALKDASLSIQTLERKIKKIEKELEKLKKEEKIKKIKKVGFWSGLGATTLITALSLMNREEKEQKTEDKTKTEEVNPEKETEIKEIKLNFHQEIYNSLPGEGKDIYKYFFERNPTPEKGYQFLDKENAVVYIFDKNNNLIAKVPAGFGKEEGDEPNTSINYNEGKTTTPSGVYLISKAVHPKDKEEYGELQFSLFGISILGDKVSLGEHQTYSGHGQFKTRTEKLNSPSPDDNKFSDGCINISPENFAKKITPNFSGDNMELFFVLQDKKSKESGIKFEVSSLVEKIIPIMLSAFEEENKKYQELISQVKDTINKLVVDSSNLKEKQTKLAQEYQKDKKNVSKQKKIEKTKIEIRDKKEELSQARKFLSWVYKKEEELKKKEQKMKNKLIELKS